MLNVSNIPACNYVSQEHGSGKVYVNSMRRNKKIPASQEILSLIQIK